MSLYLVHNVVFLMHLRVQRSLALLGLRAETSLVSLSCDRERPQKSFLPLLLNESS